MDTLVVGSDPSLKATFHSRRFRSDGWLESYAVELQALELRASTRVENPGYGHPPSKLFSELASSWRGWRGSKEWQALEGELELKATSDSTGHVTLRVRIPGYSDAVNWSAEARVLIEAGHLEQLAREASAFFSRRDA
jgi:hypothetical protein